MWIVAFVGMLYPIVPMIRYHFKSVKEENERWAELEEEIRKLEADPKNYRVKKFH
jgi:hypothetical protein